MTYLDEAQAEIATVDYFRDLGYGYVHGPERLRSNGWSYVCIAAELDRRAIKARCRRKWNWSSVRAALRNTMRETEAATVQVAG